MKRITKIASLLGTFVVVLALAAVFARTAKAVPPIVGNYQSPDLVVVYSGTSSITVYNNSPNASGGFWVYVTSGSICGGYVPEQWRYVYGLGGYQWTTLSIPQSNSATRVAVLDYYNSVRESNENNNYSWVPSVIC